LVRLVCTVGPQDRAARVASIPIIREIDVSAVVATFYWHADTHSQLLKAR
jgi:hypothetical protein